MTPKEIILIIGTPTKVPQILGKHSLIGPKLIHDRFTAVGFRELPEHCPDPSRQPSSSSSDSIHRTKTPQIPKP